MTTTIDADAHVIETDQTWSYLDPSEQCYKPVTVAQEATEGGSQRYWVIDGQLRARGGSERSYTSSASREMLDVDARLRHMDELGTDIQVLYPTVYTRKIFSSAEGDSALGRSYNRWMADIWRKGRGRLRWAAIPPLLDLERAPAELRFAKENGACAIFMRGYESERHLADPYFYPLYEEASRLDLPICVHAGSANPAVVDFLNFGGTFLVSKVPVISSFHTLLLHEVPQKFPRLRFGFVEATAQWLPHVLHDLARRVDRLVVGEHSLRGEASSEVLRKNRMYVACQTDDDLPYVLQYAGEDSIVMGTDYGHADTSAELDALNTLRRESHIGPAVVEKILDANPRALYGL
jgi:predicted TIM-barrel fold metal-dependent hydrolase